MRVLFDSNIIIDAITERANSNPSSKSIFIKAISGKINGFIASKQLTDIHYVLRKYVKDADKAREFILFLTKTFEIIPMIEDDIEMAIVLKGEDFEDDVLLACAIRNKLDAIVTNNTDDFEFYNVKIMNPKELDSIKKDIQ